MRCTFLESRMWEQTYFEGRGPGVWSSQNHSVYVPRDVSLPSVFFSDSPSPVGTGHHGTDMAKVASVCFPPNFSAPRSSRESSTRRNLSLTNSPLVASPGRVFPGSPGRSAMRDSNQEGPSDSSREQDFSPTPTTWETAGLATGR